MTTNPDELQFTSEWKQCKFCHGDGCVSCRGEGGYPVVRLRQPEPLPKADGNLTCDICQYVHPTPDSYGIVIECADGVIRCKVCRGINKWGASESCPSP
jgi:hypothetical protein